MKSNIERAEKRRLLWASYIIAPFVLVAFALLGQPASAQTSTVSGDNTVNPVTTKPQATPAPICDHAWFQAESPAHGFISALSAVDAVSANDIWAVGAYLGQTGWRPLIQHWDGTAWSVVPEPVSAPNESFLQGVDVLSATDIWAVGYYEAPNARTLVLHWDGAAWSVVPSPNFGTISNLLWGVSALSSGEVWAVGHFSSEQYLSQTLILRWNGSDWQVVPSPNASVYSNFLNAVDAVSSTDAWAVGVYYTSASTGESTLALHWNGTAWSVVSTPPYLDGGTLYDVEAIAPNDVWAVGSAVQNNFVHSALALHWDGTAWSVIPVPGFFDEYLRGVTAVASNDVWAVGYYGDGPSTRIFHWNGTDWQAVPSPNPGDYRSHTLRDVTAVAPDALWSVGEYSPGTQSIPLVIRYTDNFVDVHPTDYFYEAVRYLYCAGLISGYADGTFRPYNNITRAQVTKMVMLAQGWIRYTPKIPTFSDVPRNHPFYSFIETAYKHGVISGYSDGTFRPYDDLTRGQLCKIIVLAEGWPLYTPTTPTFTDVPTTNEFYQHIETAFFNGIITGYSDGTFRPQNYATRAHVAKIMHAAAGVP